MPNRSAHCDRTAAGAANYGADTASNILENTWGNKWVQLFINLSIASAHRVSRFPHSCRGDALLHDHSCPCTHFQKPCFTCNVCRAAVYLALRLPQMVLPVCYCMQPSIQMTCNIL